MKKNILFCLSIFFGLLLVGCPAEEEKKSEPTPVSKITWNTIIPTDFALNHQFWDNASVYFVIPDRFYNGNTSNDESYGREKGDPTVNTDAGKFYGGDIKGLTDKLDYLEDLGINAIWITAPYEQIHGWCVGGGEAFKHYPYHGYYGLDWTNMDANMGTVEEFRTFVDSAHAKGIRVIMDVVINHPGYGSLEDMKNLFPSVLKKTDIENATLSNYHSTYVNYKSHGFDEWWGGSWVRAGLCSHYSAGPSVESNPIRGSVSSLPDFKTESTEHVSIPTFLQKKYNADMKDKYPSEGYSVIPLESESDFAVADYLIYWLSSWVRIFGIDGFRCDTAKHVDLYSWYRLKVACVQALRDWKAANPSKVIPNSGDFWMTGEVNPHSVLKDEYYSDGGFDSLINFSFQGTVASCLTKSSSINNVYTIFDRDINSDDDFNVLTYISSHDTKLFYPDSAGSDSTKQKRVGSLLAFCPGAIQIFYGDEAGRGNGANFSGDTTQKTRSQMPWASNMTGYNSSLSYTFDTAIHAHWKKVLNFRKNHYSVGAGTHTKIADTPYTFSREKDNDKVVIVLDATADMAVDIDVSSIFSNGTIVHDAYSDAETTVADGKATFTPDENGVILIEKK